MRQVPGRASLLLVGDGRLAGHLSFYLRAEGLHVSQWSRRRDSRAALSNLLDDVDRVLLAIRDDALVDFVREHRRPDGAVWVHFSGSAVVDGAWSAHPLSTFAGAPYDLEVYRSIPFVVEREGPPMAELLPGLENPSAAIPRAMKPLYHALCVAAGNFTQLLWQQLFQGFEERLGLPAELAVPYLRQTGRNLENRGGHVVTGPIVRGDQGTIRSNLRALRDARLHDLADVYESFLRLVHGAPMEVAA